MAGFASYSLSGSRWASTTITYSFATTTMATSPGGAFSAVLPYLSTRAIFGGSPDSLQPNVQAAFNSWVQATGLTLKEVPDSTNPAALPDIRIGFGTLSGGALSAFSATTLNGNFQPGAELLLQDISVTPLTGSRTYRGTQIDFRHVIESAVGHALGLAAVTGPSSGLDAFNPVVISASDGSASPAFINAASVAGVEALYGPTLPQGRGGTEVLGTVDTDASNLFRAARFGVPGGTARASIPSSALVSLTADGTLQLQANQPGATAVSVPGVRAIGVASVTNGPTFIYGLSDPTGNAESIARLYQALLGRSPDLAGLYSYTQQVDQGKLSLAQIADRFASSTDFLTASPGAGGTSALAQATFVDTLYRHLFSRPIDPAGAGYVTALLNGTSRGEVANSIAQSLEARLDYLPYEGDRTLSLIYRSYEAAFGRAPEAGGLATYMPLVDAGVSAQELAAALIGSPEFAATAGAGSATSFVAQTYQNALGRGSDAAGLASYTGQINSGASHAQVFADIANSSEARAHSAVGTHDGWVSLLSLS